MTKPNLTKLKVLSQPVTSKEEGAILASLWRNIITDLGMTDRFECVIKKASDSKTVKKPMTPHAITNKVIQDTMSWKVFIKLLKDVLKAKSFKLTIEVTYAIGVTRVHTVTETKL